MTISGTVVKAIRRSTPEGSVYVTLDVQRDSGNVTRLRYLKGFDPIPAKGSTVTVDGVAMVSTKRVNIGGVRVTVEV